MENSKLETLLTAAAQMILVNLNWSEVEIVS